VLAPSHHVRTLADFSDPLHIPITVPVAPADPIVSTLVLLVVAVAATLAVAALFANKKLTGAVLMNDAWLELDQLRLSRGGRPVLQA